MKARKRVICAVMAAVLTLSLCACGAEVEPQQEEIAEEIVEEKVYETPQEADGFGSAADVFELAAENHKIYTDPAALENMKLEAYAISDKALLTQAEIEALRTEKSYAETVFSEQAKEDVDLFFRTWKYVYPSYYFMGENLFTSARQKVEKALASYQSGISGAELGDILYDAMSFLQDDHSTINGKSPTRVESKLNYLGFYDDTQTFDKDEQGFYQTYEGVKWYFSSCSRAEMRIEPILLSSGKVAYGPLILAPRSETVEEDEMILKNGEEEKTVFIRWKSCADVEADGEAQKQADVIENGDVYYIDYLTMHSDVGDVNEFIQTAYEARNHKAVILDLRHTQGWEHWQYLEWLKAFTGEIPTINAAFLTRNNALRTLKNYGGFKAVSLGNEDCSVWYERGHESRNDIPLLVLTDKSCGSSVEEACIYPRTMQNTIVIGGNTEGCAQGGSTQTYYLPHSGVPFSIGGFMEFEGETKNVDGIGYEPDIWCRPKDALLFALRFLQNYQLADESSIQEALAWAEPAAMMQLVAEQTAPAADIQLIWHECAVLPGQCFGNMTPRGDIVLVKVDGELVTDFEVSSSNPDLLTAEQTDSKNSIRLIQNQPFEGKNVAFVVAYQGNNYIFYTND